MLDRKIEDLHNSTKNYCVEQTSFLIKLIVRKTIVMNKII